jgi:hypothetical protein
MAYAALQLVARRYNRATMWDQLEAQVRALADPLPTPQHQPAEADAGRSGWLGSSRARKGWLSR